MYVVLVAAIVAGLATTLLGAAGGEEHNYRLTVSPWFRSLFVLQPDIAAMSRAGLAFQLHALIGMALFALWPFTRLVHAFTAPVRLPVPALHRLPLPHRRPGQPRGAARLGACPVNSVQKTSLDALVRNQLRRPARPPAGAPHAPSTADTNTPPTYPHRPPRRPSLAEHDSPGEATLHVLSGRVRLVTSTDAWDGRSGDLITIPATAHSVAAIEDAAVLPAPRGNKAHVISLER